MLSLSRKAGESILLPSLGIEITVRRVGGNRAWIAIEAPREVAIVRREVAERDAAAVKAQGPASPCRALERDRSMA